MILPLYAQPFLINDSDKKKKGEIFLYKRIKFNINIPEIISNYKKTNTTGIEQANKMGVVVSRTICNLFGVV